MSEPDLTKPPGASPESAETGSGWGFWITGAVLLLFALGALYYQRSTRPARQPPEPAPTSLQLTVEQICSGGAVVRIRQIDYSPVEEGPGGNKVRSTYVLAQPTDGQYVVSCNAGGDYREYLRVGQLARLSMDAG